MMRLKSHGPEVPPDGHRYSFPDGYVARQSFYNDWINDISKHYRDNDIPRPENWVQIAEDQLCRLLPPGYCTQADGSDVMQHIDTRLHAFQIFHGAVVLANLVKDREDAIVDQATADARAAICISCPANITVEGCLPCLKISDVIMSVTGPNRTTQSDHAARQCGICSCPVKSLVWVKPDILNKGMTQGMRDKYKLVREWCWRAQEIEAEEQPA